MHSERSTSKFIIYFVRRTLLKFQRWNEAIPLESWVFLLDGSEFSEGAH